MELRCRIYVTRQGCENNHKALETTEQLRGVLFRYYTEGRIEGYAIAPGLDEEDYDDHDIDQDLVEKITGGKFPFIFINITYDQKKVNLESQTLAPIEGLAQEYGLLLAAS